MPKQKTTKGVRGAPGEPKSILCPRCHGTGYQSKNVFLDCIDCGGRGVVTKNA